MFYVQLASLGGLFRSSEDRFRGILTLLGDLVYIYKNFKLRYLFLKALRTGFQDLHIQKWHPKSSHLAKTESLLIFVEQKLSSGPM